MLNEYRYRAGQLSVALTEIHFTGEDVASFIQTQSTYDINLVPQGCFHLISFLDPQGRVECYGWLLNENANFSFLVPSSLIEQTVLRLNKFLISEDVNLSHPTEHNFYFLLGPDSSKYKKVSSLKGILFEEETFLQREKSPDLNIISSEESELWRGLTGWPSFDGSDYSHEILNNLRLFDLALAPNKGCYPGQETVSKIATRRGAAYSPVLIETKTEEQPGVINAFEKKIGTSSGSFSWEGKFYLAASLLRDFRVEKMKLQFQLNGKTHEGIVRYYPLLSGDKKIKAQELYYEATDCFKNEELKLAEEKFRLAIKIDPGFADAYESLGVMLGRQERFQEAIDLMKTLSEIDPGSVLAHTNMSLYLMRLGKIAEAEEQKSLATVKSFQSFGDEAKKKEAEEQRKKQLEAEWSQRESMFKQVLEIDPDDTLANYGLGSIAVEKGEWLIAKGHLERVLSQDPKYSVAYLALGKALKGLGRIAEARKIWEEGIKVSAAKGDLMPANQMQQELSS